MYNYEHASLINTTLFYVSCEQTSVAYFHQNSIKYCHNYVVLQIK